MKIVTLQVKFEEKEFKKLQNAKEIAKILGKAVSWEDWILKMAKVRRK